MSYRAIPTLSGCSSGCGPIIVTPNRGYCHVPAAINIFPGCCSGGWGGCCNSALNWAYFGLNAVNSLVGWIGAFRNMGSCGMGMFGMGNMFGGGMNLGGIYGGGAAGATDSGNTTKTDKDAAAIEQMRSDWKAALGLDPADQKTKNNVRDLYIRVMQYLSHPLDDDIDTNKNKRDLDTLKSSIEDYMKRNGIEIPEVDIQNAEGTKAEDPNAEAQKAEAQKAEDQNAGKTQKVTINNKYVELLADKLGDNYTASDVKADKIQLATDGDDENGTNAKTKNVVRKPSDVNAVKITLGTNSDSMPNEIKITTEEGKTYTYEYVQMAEGRAVYKSKGDDNDNVYVLVNKGDKFYLTQPYSSDVLGKGKKDTQCG